MNPARRSVGRNWRGGLRDRFFAVALGGVIAPAFLYCSSYAVLRLTGVMRVEEVSTVGCNLREGTCTYGVFRGVRSQRSDWPWIELVFSRAMEAEDSLWDD